MIKEYFQLKKERKISKLNGKYGDGKVLFDRG